MKKFTLFLISIIILSSSVFAGTNEKVNADQYTITIQSIKMCEDATINSETSFSVSGCITLSNSPLTVDITSATAGSTIGKYADTTALVAGTTYRYFVPTLSRTFTISGGGVVDSQIIGSFTCNTNENATRGGLDRHLTQLVGQVGGSPTAIDVFVPSETNVGIICRDRNCIDRQVGTTVTHDIPDDTTLYGNAINVPTDNSENFEMLYTISSPFVMRDLPPMINMSFGTKGALEVESMVDINGMDICKVGPYYPKFTVTVTNLE
tara:strand:- start:201 stop:995 length:795 start_codon:yes stop_codon:yes gene_type:complete